MHYLPRKTICTECFIWKYHKHFHMCQLVAKKSGKWDRIFWKFFSCCLKSHGPSSRPTICRERVHKSSHLICTANPMTRFYMKCEGKIQGQKTSGFRVQCQIFRGRNSWVSATKISGIASKKIGKISCMVFLIKEL